MVLFFDYIRSSNNILVTILGYEYNCNIKELNFLCAFLILIGYLIC